MSVPLRLAAGLALAVGISSPLVARPQGQPPALATQRAACELLLRDGRAVAADALHGGATGRLRVVAAGREEVLDADQVLAVLGAAIQPSRLPSVHLRGGDVVRGLLVGGDGAGNQLEVQSPTLSRLRLSVDRLECLVLRPDLARAADLVLPEGEDEALFQQATLGFDRVVGTLHQFGEPGIRFEPRGRDAPEWYGVRDLIGLRLGGALDAPKKPMAELWTRSGDRLGLSSFEFAGDAVHATVEGDQRVTLPLGDLGCLLRLDRGAVFLSSLQPVAEVEAAHDGLVLLPWQRDASVTGTPLMAGGRSYGRGLGVHSRSRLEFRVPEGMSTFAARVAFDDSALQLPVRGTVAVAVRVGSDEVFAERDLRAGEPPRSIGPVPVRPGQVVSLEVDFGGGRDLGDRVDWLLPMFLPR